MRNRGPQKQTPLMWCMGAEDPLAFLAGPLGAQEVDQAGLAHFGGLPRAAGV
jgi:hypothetical protein